MNLFLIRLIFIIILVLIPITIINYYYYLNCIITTTIQHLHLMAAILIIIPFIKVEAKVEAIPDLYGRQ